MFVADGLELVRRAAEARLPGALDRLAPFVAIPSVSSDPERAEDVRAAAVWARDEALLWGARSARLLETDGAPAVAARFPASRPGAPCVLVYCHYDVQPAEPTEEWQSPPFELTRREGYLYGRGAADDKGPILAHLAALAAWRDHAGGPPVEIVLVLDGEEESGSPHLHQALAVLSQELSTDLVVVSDTSILGAGRPSLCYGLRGTCALEITVRTADHDLHSGRFGGVAPNAASELARLIAALHDADGRVAVPGFYSAVRRPDASERRRLAELGIDDTAMLAGTGARGHGGERGFGTLERAWARPSLDVNGLCSGHTRRGSKTIIPATATAKLSARLVPDQRPRAVADAIADHVTSLAPDHVDVDVSMVHGGPPLVTPVDSPAVDAALAAYHAGYGVVPVLTREGGSVPVVAEVASALDAVPLFLGFGLPDQSEHAPNERLSLVNVQRAVRTFATFWGLLAQAIDPGTEPVARSSAPGTATGSRSSSGEWPTT